ARGRRPEGCAGGEPRAARWAARGARCEMGDARLPFREVRGTILPLARPLTTEDGVTGADAKTALERGRPVVLVCPPAPENAQHLWELLGPIRGRGPELGPPVLLVCADHAAAAEWPALAPAGLRVHAAPGRGRL